MNDEINFEARNKLTEHTSNYRLVNCALWHSYIALEGKLSQLGSYLFCKLLDGRLYGDKAKTKNNEDKRIYIDSEVTMESILRDINPKKYANNEKALLSDQTNLSRRIDALDKINAFYNWKYKKFYVFIMERDIGCWKYYNDNAYVVPKTVKKIVALSGDMIQFMIGVTKNNNLFDNEEDIRLSYGKFLRRIVGKMNPLVAHTLPVWRNESLGDYLSMLSEALDKTKEHGGVSQSEDFHKNIPSTVAKKFKKYVDRSIKEFSMSTEDTMIKEIEKEEVKSLESDLVPKDQNIVKKKREKRPKTTFKMPENPPEPSEPKLYRFDAEFDPFKDAKEFMKYYRSFLTMKFARSVKFDKFENDAVYSAQILDLLIINKRNDKVFLNGWLSNFCEQKLKGGKAFKAQYTSMKALKDTFAEFNPLFPYVDI